MRDDKSSWRAVALASQVGCSIAIPLIIFVAGGIWLDALLGIRPVFLVIGTLLGLTLGFFAIYELFTFKRDRGPHDSDRGQGS
jgi:F0F1-type ATP synthase assembly protein I